MRQTMRQKIESLTEYKFFDRGKDRRVNVIAKDRKDIGYFKKENNQILFVSLGKDGEQCSQEGVLNAEVIDSFLFMNSENIMYMI